MLDFIGNTFKELFSIIIIIAIILVVIVGFVFMSDSFLIGFLILVCGIILIILSAGMVSLFINIRDDLHFIKNNLISPDESSSGKVNFNSSNKKCPFCAEDIKPGAIICPHCRKNIKEFEDEQKIKIQEEIKIKQEEKDKKRKEIDDGKYENLIKLLDGETLDMANKVRNRFGEREYIAYIKSVAKERGYGDIE